MQITRKSTLSGETATLDLDVTEEQLALYATGTVALQDVFPHLPADEREFIKSGITPGEWDRFLGTEDE